MFWITTKATPEPFLWELATVGTMIPTLIGWSATGKVNKMNFFLVSDLYPDLALRRQRPQEGSNYSFFTKEK